MCDFNLFGVSSDISITVNLTNILYGYAAGWTSYSFLILESPSESPLETGTLSQDERSWVTSLFAISGVLGTVIYYFCGDLLGRKISLCSIAVPHLVRKFILFAY